MQTGRLGNGIFASCVTFAAGGVSSSCANCHMWRQGKRCIFESDPSTATTDSPPRKNLPATSPGEDSLAKPMQEAKSQISEKVAQIRDIAASLDATTLEYMTELRELSPEVGTSDFTEYLQTAQKATWATTIALDAIGK